MFDSTVLEYSRCAYTLLYLIKNSCWIMISTSYPIVPEFAGYHPDRPHIHNITTKKYKILFLEFKSLLPSFKMLVNFLLLLPQNIFLRLRRNLVFATNWNFLITISLQPYGVNLWYFKLRFFDLREFIVWNIPSLRHLFAKIKKL